VTVRNLVEIDAVISTTYTIFNIVRVKLQSAYSRPQNSFLGENLTPKIGIGMNETPKRHFLARKHVV